jgi:hypothetical protein
MLLSADMKKKKKFTELIVKRSIIDDRVTGEFYFIAYLLIRVLLQDEEKLK